MAVATIWNRREINAIFQYYPDIKAIQQKSKKSAYKINKKAEELGIISPKPSPAKRNIENTPCKLWEQKHRHISEIESDITQLEAKIIKGIDLGPEWNKTKQKYNALLFEYERALKIEKI